MQFSNLSIEDINRLRAKFGSPPLATTEAKSVRQGLLDAGVISGEKVLAAPGTSARKRQEAEDPEWVAQKVAERNRARGAAQNKNKLQKNAPGKPEGVSQWLWDRVVGGNMNINPTSVTRNPVVRDALIAAGKEDYVKAMYERHMDNNAAHAIGNGADPSAAWGRANNSIGNDWYKTNYGTYSNGTVAGSTGASGAGDFTFGGGTTPEGTVENPYVPPQPPVDNGGSVGDPPPIDSGPEDPGPGPGPDPIVLDPLGSTEMTNRAGTNSFMAGRNKGMLNPNHAPMPVKQPPLTAPPRPSHPPSTPFADAYLKAKAAAEAPGPVSKLFANELKGY